MKPGQIFSTSNPKSFKSDNVTKLLSINKVDEVMEKIEPKLNQLI